MKQQLAIVIAALMIASIAFAIPTTVSAAHDQTPKIDETTVKGNTSMILTITVTNAGPAAIDNVWITVPSDFKGFAPTIKVPKDNELECVDNKIVILPKGTIVRIVGAEDVTLYENTDVIREKDTWVWVPILGENAKLNDNALVEVTGDRTIASGLGADDNVAPAEDTTVTLTDNLLRLLEDAVVVRVNGNMVRLPKDIMLELVGTGVQTGDNLMIDDNVTVENDIGVTPTENGVRVVQSVSVLRGGAMEGTLGAGVLLELMDVNDVIIPSGTTVKLSLDAAVTLPDNTDVKRVSGDQMLLLDLTAAENQPKNWMQTVLPSNTVEWKGIGDNQIASGANLEFPFAVKTPDISGTYTILVRTKDTDNDVTIKEVTITVDATHPTIELAVSPEWAKASTKVTITVTADEPLAKLDNVMVAENEDTENVQVEMTPNADRTVWTGTYTTTDNENRDGLARVWVIGEQLEDMLGNECESNENAMFYVDKLKPPTPDLTTITGLPDTPTTNDATWFIEGNSRDNYRASGTYPNAFEQENMKVKIRVGAKTYEVTSGEDGYFYKSITLTEGIQEIGIRYIDLAGNEGEENAENITLDTKAPSIAWGTIAGEALVDGIHLNDNAPKITLTISDAGLGVDNSPFGEEGDNMGYSVQLWGAGKTPSTLTPENLVNALAHDNNILEFENTLPELTDNTYYIYAVAGDNWQMDNDFIKFVIDTLAPSAPSVDAAYTIVSTMDNPVVVKSTSRTIAGDAETGATITVYGTVDTTETVLGTGTAGSGWTVTLTLTTGSNTKIEISATDVAGNEGPRTLYGWMLADASAPAVTLGTLPGTTDETSVILSGTVDKDAWEDWSDITLTVQVGIGSVEVQIGAEGGYSCSVPLSMGVNTIAVRATDSVGNAGIPATATVERVFTMDKTAPSVTLDALPEATDKSSITISGTVSKDAGEDWSDITLTVQVGTGRVEVPIGAGGSYSYSVGLAEGPNTIAVQATDGVGNTGTAAYAMVERTVTPWGTYAIILVIVALVMAAIAIFRKKR